MNRLIVAFLFCAAALGAPAPTPAASVPAFSIRNATNQVVYVEVEQKTPYQRLTRLYVNPRRSESRYFTGPLGRFEVLVTVYSGKEKVVLPPKEMTVRTGNEGNIIIDYVASGENDENLDFAVHVVSAP